MILDGVFNHSSRGFFAFYDILENQQNSAYKDWFHIKNFPIDAYSPGNANSYLAWWGYKSLPKFNIDNSEVRSYLLDIARYWIEQGADGWRLDVPNEIDDDEFWSEFRYTVKSINRDAYLVGEIWTADPRWVGDDHFDGLMNYPVRDAILDWLSGDGLTASGFADRIENLLKLYARENAYAMYVPLGSHDTERLRTCLGENSAKEKLAFTIQFAYPGAPAIYYGDEIGLTGGKDPECRAAFPWNRDVWISDLRTWLQNLISIRKQKAVLRRGNFQRIFIDDHRRCYAFARTLGDESILVVLNASPIQRHLRIKVGDLRWADGRILRNLLGREEYVVAGDTILVSLPPWTGAWVG